MVGRPNIARILEDQDVTALGEAMRFGPDVKVRQLAARAAGQWGNYEMVEALVRAMREDPEDLVRKEAHEALYEMLGKRSEEVIAAYSREEYEDPWIITEITPDEETVEKGSAWGEESINALYMMASDDRDETKGVKAVKALGQINSTRAVETLISLHLNAASEKVRTAAGDVLHDFYGDETDEVLASYQLDEDEVEDEDLTEEEDQAGWVELPQEGASLRSQAPAEPPSVLKEEGLSLMQFLLVGIGVLVIIGLVTMALR